MKRQPVKSSNLVAVGYDAHARLLELEFANGRVYQYAGVDAETYETLLQSSSKGKFFFSSIRGKYAETEVTAEKLVLTAAPFSEAFLKTFYALRLNLMAHGWQPLVFAVHPDTVQRDTADGEMIGAIEGIRLIADRRVGIGDIFFDQSEVR